MHTEYDPALNPTLAGRVTTSSVLFEPTTFAKELAFTVGELQLVPKANITRRTLITASRPIPLTVMIVDAPEDPANTVVGEKAVAVGTYKVPFPTFWYLLLGSALTVEHTE